MDDKQKQEVAATIEENIEFGFGSEDDIVKAALSKLLNQEQRHRSDSPAELRDMNGQEPAVRQLVKEAMARRQQLESTWTELTDCDRLNWVFDHLERQGIAARQNYWCCATCANFAISDEIRSAAIPYIGYIYYHEQNTQNAASGGVIEIRYASRRNDDEGSRRVGLRVMKAAKLAGLQTSWSGSPDETIVIKLKWRRRHFDCPDNLKRLLPLIEIDFNPLNPDDDAIDGLVFTPIPPRVLAAREAERRRKEEERKALEERQRLLQVPDGATCSDCNSTDLVPRAGKYGDFLECTKCRHSQLFPKNLAAEPSMPCPKEGCDGKIIAKEVRKFTCYQCTNYEGKDGCRIVYFDPPLLSGGPNGDGLCPKCRSLLVYKGSKIACSSKECGFIQAAIGNEAHPWMKANA